MITGPTTPAKAVGARNTVRQPRFRRRHPCNLITARVDGVVGVDEIPLCDTVIGRIDDNAGAHRDTTRTALRRWLSPRHPCCSDGLGGGGFVQGGQTRIRGVARTVGRALPRRARAFSDRVVGLSKRGSPARVRFPLQRLHFAILESDAAAGHIRGLTGRRRWTCYTGGHGSDAPSSSCCVCSCCAAPVRRPVVTLPRRWNHQAPLRLLPPVRSSPGFGRPH